MGEPGDVESIARLSQDAFEGQYDFDWRRNAETLLNACKAGNVTLGIAEMDARVIGYCNLRPWPAGGWIDQLVVGRNHRRKGIGRALVDYIMEQARRRGFWKVSLVASESDFDALGFYESYGFERVGRMRDEVRVGLDGILMSYVVDYDLHPNR